jgi:hypothetical protein
MVGTANSIAIDFDVKEKSLTGIYLSAIAWGLTANNWPPYIALDNDPPRLVPQDIATTFVE